MHNRLHQAHTGDAAERFSAIEIRDVEIVPLGSVEAPEMDDASAGQTAPADPLDQLLVERPGDVEPALREAFRRKDDLVLMDFMTDQTENVYPMVQGGKGLTEMILAEEL